MYSIHTFLLSSLPHKNGLELKNPQEIYITIFSLIHACTKNGYVVATSPLPCLKEWRVINVLEQVTIQPCIILIRSFSVDQAKAVCKIIYIHEENFIWHPRFFHKTSLSIAGQRIVLVQDSQREICTETYLVSRLHERTKLTCFDQSYKYNKNNSCHHNWSDTHCMPPSMRESPLWYLVYGSPLLVQDC